MIDNLKTPIIDDKEDETYCWYLLGQIEERINKIAEDQAKIAEDQAKIAEDQAKIAEDFEKIAEDQMGLREQIALELKYSEEDLKFFKDWNTRLSLCMFP